MHRILIALTAAALGCAGCAGAIVQPAAAPAKPAADALLILPGFGYGRDGERVFRSLKSSIAADGFDLYLPTSVARSGLDDSRERVQRFVREQRLGRYQRLHVFAFLAGGWTLNPLVEKDALPNLATIVYDRSPYQERAPRIALERLKLLTWLRYGPVVFDVARTPYTPVSEPDVKVGLLIETTPTAFVTRYADDADRLGAYRFDCDAFEQRHDDCFYVDLNHSELYTRFGEIWPEVRAFIRTSRFTDRANRTPPAGGPLTVAAFRRRTS